MEHQDQLQFSFAPIYAPFVWQPRGEGHAEDDDEEESDSNGQKFLHFLPCERECVLKSYYFVTLCCNIFFFIYFFISLP